MYCNAKRSLGKGRNCQLAMSRQGSTFSRRVATKGSKWVFLAASGIGAMKVVSNFIILNHRKPFFNEMLIIVLVWLSVFVISCTYFNVPIQVLKQ